jgi:multidrug efflux pump subunit AcrB
VVRRQHVTKAMLSVRGVGRRGARRRRHDAKCASSSTRPACWRCNATAADISRQLRQIQQEASGGRADVGGAEQSVRTIATVQSAEELGALEIRCPTAAACASTRWPRSATRWPSSAAAALLNGKPVVGFEITRSRGAGEVDVADGVRARAAGRKLKAEHPGHHVTEAFNFVDPVRRTSKAR